MPDIRLFQKSPITFLPDDTFPALTASEEEIKNQTYDRKEHQNQYPGHSLYRVTIVEYHNNNRTDNGSEIDDIESHCCYLAEYKIPINHSSKCREKDWYIKVYDSLD